MTNQEQVFDDNRDIYLKSDGVLKGNLLTVATLIVYADDRSPIKGLEISNVFLSGNELPVGRIKAFNDYYDEKTGQYWFDLKVNPVTKPTNFVFQTTGYINGKRIPIRFDVMVCGQSKAEVSDIEFDGNIMRFNVSSSDGKLLRYPLGILAHRDIIAPATPIGTKGVSIPYAFATGFVNNSQYVCAVMGCVEIDGRRHNWLAKKEVQTNDCTLLLEQVGPRTIQVDLELLRPITGEVGIKLPINFKYEQSPSIGICNLVDNLHIDNQDVAFEIPFSEFKSVDTLLIDFQLKDPDNSNAPIFVKGKVPVKRWNNGQTEIEIVEIRHQYFNGIESLELALLWAGDKEPVTGFTAHCNQDNTSLSIKHNVLTLRRAVKADPYKADTLTLSGEISLSAFGIDEPVVFEKSITVGSNILPVRTATALATVREDQLDFHVAVRQNNGDIFNSVTVKSLGDDFPIHNQNYDTESGVVSFTTDKEHYKLIDGVVLLNVSLDVEADDTYSFELYDEVKVDIPYKVDVTDPVFEYKKDSQGENKVVVTWQFKDNRNKRPVSIILNEFKVNGKDTECTSKYSQAYGTLIVEFPIELEHGEDLHIAAVTSSPGLGEFIYPPVVNTQYKLPGSATYVGHKFFKADGIPKVTVYFDIQGWKATPPNEVSIDDYSWTRIKGVKLGKVYSEYDKETGKLSVTFGIFDQSASIFSGETEIRFDNSDASVYPIKFSFAQ